MMFGGRIVVRRRERLVDRSRSKWMDLSVGVAIGSQHRWNRLTTRLRHRDAWDALDDAWLFHERGIELRGDAADDRTVVAWEAGVGWVRGGRAPEVVACVGEEVGLGPGEEGGFTAVSLCKDDFVEELDRRVICALTFAFVDEFIETLCLLQGRQVLHILARLALHELFHLELVEHASLLSVASSRYQEASVSVQQASETSNK